MDVTQTDQTHFMTFRCSLVLLGLAGATANTAIAAPARKILPAGPVSFTSKSQHFALWLPTPPTENQIPVRLKDGQTGKVYMFESKSEGISFLVVSAPVTGVTKTLKNGLDEGQKSFLESSGATIQKREDIQLAGFPGRDLLVTTFMGRPGRTRLFQTPRFYYQIVARGDKALTKKQAAQIKRVFDSFRILPQ